MTKTQSRKPRPKNAGKTNRRSSAQKTGPANRPDAIPDEAANSVSSGKPTILDLFTNLLNGLDGASIAELAEATGWQPHSVRGAMSGALKRKGLTITSEVTDGVRRYRIGAPE